MNEKQIGTCIYCEEPVLESEAFIEKDTILLHDDCQKDLKEKIKERNEAKNEPQRDIHQYFELTYAQYLAIPRSVLQSMPEEWQEKFVKLLDELRETEWYNLLPKDVDYKIELRKTNYNLDKFKWGIKVIDPLADYQRGRRNIFAEG